MIIRAIDPGPVRSAYVDWDGKQIYNFGVFENGYYQTLETHPEMTHCYIEMPACYGMPVGKDIFETCFWVGRFFEINARMSLQSRKLYRKEIKLHLCNSARAKDSNVTAAIVDRFDPMREFGKQGKGTKNNPGMFYGFSGDVWAAFAVALTAFDSLS